MSSSTDGISLPSPAFYSSNSRLPWGLTNPINTNPPASPTADPGITQEYSLLQTEDTEELLYGSFLSPDAGIANADEVLAQGAELLGAPTLSTGTQGAPATSTSGANSTSNDSSSSSSSSTTSSGQTTLPTDVSNLPTYAQLISQSDAAANAVLSEYANAPAGSSIVDYQA